MWPRTCDPRPSWNRPAEISWTSLACTATFIGLRANATAIAECSEIVLVARPASDSTVNGSCLVSGTPNPSYPDDSAASSDDVTCAPASISMTHLRNPGLPVRAHAILHQKPQQLPDPRGRG